MTDDPDREVTPDTLAAWLGTSPRQVRAWGAAGIAVRSGRGRYLLRASVAAVVAHLRSVAAGRGDGALDLAQERAALARAQREAQELRNRERRGELVDAADPERAMVSLATMVSGRLQGVGSGIAQEAHAAGSVAQCEAVIAGAIHDALRDIAEQGQRAAERLEAMMAAAEADAQEPTR